MLPNLVPFLLKTLFLGAFLATPGYGHALDRLNDANHKTLSTIDHQEIRVEVGGKLALCSHNEKGSIDLSVSGGQPPYSYKWNTNETTPNRTNLYAGTYTVWITDAAGTVHKESIVVQPPFPFLLNPLETTDATCSSGNVGSAKLSVKIGRGEPYRITWSHGLNDTWEAKYMAPGTYTVVVSDQYHCDVSVSFEIKANTGIQVKESIQNPNCTDPSSGAINLNVQGGIGPYTYLWSTGATAKDLENLPP